MSKRSDSGLDGILLIDKPAGWTSHDVVAKARGITGQRRIGHTGTLDPMATGLLVLCLGRATRLVEYLMGHDKRYTGTIVLGRTTDTDDAEGGTVSESPVPAIDARTLEGNLAAFRGSILQVPPAFSALKVSGQRSYDLARKGSPPELAPRQVTIRSLIASLSGPGIVEVDVTCSAGTYIRSLARDLGAAIGCGAHLGSLRRRSAGPFPLEDAVSMDALEDAVAAGALDELLIQPDDGITNLDAAILPAAAVTAITTGQAWQALKLPARAAQPVRIYADSGEFVGVGSVSSSGEIRAGKVLLRMKSTK